MKKRSLAAVVALAASSAAFVIGYTMPDSELAVVWGALLVLCMAVCAVALVVLGLGAQS